MSLTQLVKTVRAPFNQGVGGLYAQLVTWLASVPNIIIQDVDWFRPQSAYAGDESRVRISYLLATSPAIGGTWTAALYQDSGAVTAQAAMNLDYAGGRQTVPFFIIDVTDHSKGRTGPNSLLVIGMQTGGVNLGLVGHDRATFIAEAAAPIASGATGLADFYDATGRKVATGLTIRNVGAVAWAQTQRNYIIMDETSGEFIGLPSCAGTTAVPDPVATTTTSYPCPAFLSGQTKPVGS